MNISIKKRFNSIKLPARASLFYIGAGAVGKLTGVLFTPLFTRILSGEEYGEYARYLSIVGVASVIGSSLTSSSAIYKGLEEKTTQSKDYLKSVLVINLAFSLVFCLLLFTFNRFLGVKLSFLIPISLQIFADGITAVYLTGAKFKYKYLPVTAILLIGSLIPPILSAFIISRVGKGFIVRTYCLLTVSIITASFSLIKIWCDGKVSLSLVKNAFRSTMPLIPHGLSNAVSSQADKLILASVMGAKSLAKYSIVFSLGMALQFTVTALSSALSPWIIRRLKAAEQEKISSLTFPILISYLSLSICLVALAPEAMNILAPPDYLDALPALVPIALSVPLSFASGVLTVILVYFGKGGYTALVSSIGSAICIILNYTLISYFGYLGAGLSLLICQAFVAFSEVYAIKKIGFKDALPFNKILLCCLIGFLGCVGVYMLRERFILRLFFLIIPAFVLLLCLVRIKDLVFEKRGKNPS